MDILLVDDEEDILRSVGGLLVDFGHGVISARDGADALRLLEEREGIGLVVSDIQMPEMDGLELLRSVRARWPDLPVILMTGHGDADHAVAAFHSGAYDYVRKPVRLKDLLACIERVEEQARLTAFLLRERQRLSLGGEAGVGTALAGVACEVQTSATSAMGHLQSLETFWKTSQGYLSEAHPEDLSERKALDFILRETPGLLSGMRSRLERIADVVRDVGAFARPEGEGERKPINLVGPLKEAIEAVGTAQEASYGSEVIRVRANRQDLYRVFFHLLSNAALAVRGREGGAVRVTVRKKTGVGEWESGRKSESRVGEKAEAEWAEVTVEDNGPGVPAEVRGRVFDPFFSTRPVGEGLGLGLSICRETVREHGGEMTFESREGEGTRFGVRLPVAQEGAQQG